MSHITEPRENDSPLVYDRLASDTREGLLIQSAVCERLAEAVFFVFWGEIVHWEERERAKLSNTLTVEHTQQIDVLVSEIH